MIGGGEPTDEHFEKLWMFGDGRFQRPKAKGIGLCCFAGRSMRVGDDRDKDRHGSSKDIDQRMSNDKLNHLYIPIISSDVERREEQTHILS